MVSRVDFQKLRRQPFVVLVALALCSCISQSRQAIAVEQVSLAQILPSGEFVVEFMKFNTTPRFEELGAKLKSGMAADSEWFVKQSQAATPSTPILYTPKLGLSELEYEEFLRLHKSIRLVPRGINKTLKISHINDRISFRLKDKSLPLLESMEINIIDDQLTVDEKSFGKAKWMLIETGGGMFGPWRGYKWSLESGSAAELSRHLPDDPTKVELREETLVLANPLGTNFAYFYYTLRDITQGESKRVDILFRYKTDRINIQAVADSANP